MLLADLLHIGLEVSGKSFASKEAPGLENFNGSTRYLVSRFCGGR